MKRITNFIERAKLVHGDKYDYSKTNYTGASGNIIIICPAHGEFSQNAFSHLRGYGCIKCSTIGAPPLQVSDFLFRANLKFPNKFDYSKATFSRASDSIIIICPDHGEFTTTPTRFLQTAHGCPKCFNVISSMKNSLTLESFIEKSRLLHGSKYDYSLVKYVNQTTPIRIICPYHGIFITTPQIHLKGCNCKQCVTSGWDKTSWIKICQENKNSSPCVYIIKCFNESETFFKIGRTMRSIKDRFLRPTIMPYSYELIERIHGTAEEIFNTEIKMHKENRKHKYYPQIIFPGSTECFSQYKKIQNE